MKQFIFITSLLLCLNIFAEKSYAASPRESYEKGCALYSKNEYRAAAKQFEEASQSIRSTDIQYNLGNCYYRLNDYPHARLAYERAVSIDPSNSDAKYNLKITVAKIKYAGAQPQSFISSYAHDFLHSNSIARWAVYSLVGFALVLMCTLLYFFGNALWLRKGAFFGGLILTFVTALSLVCAGILTVQGGEPTEAIVLQQIQIRQSPSGNSKSLLQILPGAKIKITSESSVKGWKQVSLDGGQNGWIPTAAIGLI